MKTTEAPKMATAVGMPQNEAEKRVYQERVEVVFKEIKRRINADNSGHNAICMLRQLLCENPKDTTVNTWEFTELKHACIEMLVLLSNPIVSGLVKGLKGSDELGRHLGQMITVFDAMDNDLIQMELDSYTLFNTMNVLPSDLEYFETAYPTINN